MGSNDVSVYSTARPTSPDEEARSLFVLAFSHGQTIERVRQSIPINTAERKLLEGELGVEVESLIRFRAEVLTAFDMLVADPPSKLLERARRRREQIKRATAEQIIDRREYNRAAWRCHRAAAE